MPVEAKIKLFLFCLFRENKINQIKSRAAWLGQKTAQSQWVISKNSMKCKTQEKIAISALPVRSLRI